MKRRVEPTVMYTWAKDIKNLRSFSLGATFLTAVTLIRSPLLSEIISASVLAPVKHRMRFL